MPWPCCCHTGMLVKADEMFLTLSCYTLYLIIHRVRNDLNHWCIFLLQGCPHVRINLRPCCKCLTNSRVNWAASIFLRLLLTRLFLYPPQALFYFNMTLWVSASTVTSLDSAGPGWVIEAVLTPRLWCLLSRWWICYKDRSSHTVPPLVQCNVFESGL